MFRKGVVRFLFVDLTKFYGDLFFQILMLHLEAFKTFHFVIENSTLPHF